MAKGPIGAIEIAVSWDELRTWYNDTLNVQSDGRPPKWIFRGDRYCSMDYQQDVKKYKDSEGSLCKTSLEKACDAFGVPSEERPEREKDIIREFQRKSHLYTPHTPARSDLIEWLALMQHHYAPTRLLDWTYSFSVAAYFALAELNCEAVVPDYKVENQGCDVAHNARRDVAEVWAIDSRWFSEEAERSLDQAEIDRVSSRIRRKSDTEYVDDFGVRHNAIVHHLLENPKPLVFAINPFRMNQRLTIQQGVFLLTGDTGKPFLENLCSDMYGDSPDLHIRRVRLPVTTKQRCSIIKEFYRTNMSNVTLFPGLDGFAKSMKERLAFSLDEILFQPLPPYWFL
jgi:hypothetical protein